MNPLNFSPIFEGKWLPSSIRTALRFGVPPIKKVDKEDCEFELAKSSKFGEDGDDDDEDGLVEK